MRRESVRTIERRMGYILDDLQFPAVRWQLITHAEFYGADALSIAYLHGVPARRYADVASVVQGIIAGLPGNSAVLRVAPDVAIRRPGPAHRTAKAS